ncbi:xylanase [Gemmatimonadetes bacterium T265]|nr:xylanase [Gemmatimonadetes bacterium T265]
MPPQHLMPARSLSAPHRLIGVVLSLVLTACGQRAADATPADAAGPSPAGASRTATALAGSATTPSAAAAVANPQGRIPVLEYHVIGAPKNSLYSRTLDSFKADLETAYRLGYRPITVAQMLDKDFRDVPAGMSPVVLVFDDASPSQFRYLDRGNGRLDIDPTSATGVLVDFNRRHPDWKLRGTYCLLNGGAAGHNFFGDAPPKDPAKFDGQRREWRFPKVQWLAKNGFELCDHTVWHAMLSKYPDAVVQEQIARNMMGIDSAVPGYRVRTMALPYGLWPKNRPLAWQGSWTDPKTGQAHPYHFEAVLEVAGGPARSPYDPAFNAHSINRIEAIGNDIPNQLERLAKTNARFVK